MKRLRRRIAAVALVALRDLRGAAPPKDAHAARRRLAGDPAGHRRPAAGAEGRRRSEGDHLLAAPGIRAAIRDAGAISCGWCAKATARCSTRATTQFLEGAVIDGAAIQPLQLVLPDNTVLVALYTMMQGEGRQTAQLAHRRLRDRAVDGAVDLSGTHLSCQAGGDADLARARFAHQRFLRAASCVPRGDRLARAVAHRPTPDASSIGDVARLQRGDLRARTSARLALARSPCSSGRRRRCARPCRAPIRRAIQVEPRAAPSPRPAASQSRRTASDGARRCRMQVARAAPRPDERARHRVHHRQLRLGRALAVDGHREHAPHRWRATPRLPVFVEARLRRPPFEMREHRRRIAALSRAVGEQQRRHAVVGVARRPVGQAVDRVALGRTRLHAAPGRRSRASRDRACRPARRRARPRNARTCDAMSPRSSCPRPNSRAGRSPSACARATRRRAGRLPAASATAARRRR